MLKLGCARVSSDEQESHPKRDALSALGVAPERIYIAHGVTGTNQHRPGSSARPAAIRSEPISPTDELEVMC